MGWDRCRPAAMQADAQRGGSYGSGNTRAEMPRGCKENMCAFFVVVPPQKRGKVKQKGEEEKFALVATQSSGPDMKKRAQSTRSYATIKSDYQGMPSSGVRNARA
jgi:hypothetical protein